MAKIYKSQEEINADIKDNKLIIQGDVLFEIPFKIEASIRGYFRKRE